MRARKFFTFLGWPLILAPYLLGIMGSVSNQLVIARNLGMMPVETSVCYYADSPPRAIIDPIHRCMAKSDHLRVLADWIYVGDGVASPGDILVDAGEAVDIPFLYIWLTLLTVSSLAKKDFWLE